MAQSTSEYYKSNPKAAAKRRVQQRRYNKGKGGEITRNANALRAKLGIPKGDPRDAGHYAPTGSTAQTVCLAGSFAPSTGCLLYTSPSPRD